MDVSAIAVFGVLVAAVITIVCVMGIIFRGCEGGDTSGAGMDEFRSVLSSYGRLVSAGRHQGRFGGFGNNGDGDGNGGNDHGCSVGGQQRIV